MNNISGHVWIAYLATLGCILAGVAYCVVRPNNDAAQQFVFQIANSLISGAVGAFTAYRSTGTPPTLPTLPPVPPPVELAPPAHA